MKTIGRIIKELRREMDCTQSKLAEVLGVTQDSISLWENGKRIPDTHYVVEMARFFEVSTDYLLGITDDYRSVGVGQDEKTTFAFTLEERRLIGKYRELSEKERQLLARYLDLLK